MGIFIALSALAAVAQEPKEKELREMSGVEIVEWMTKESGRKLAYTEDLGLGRKKVRVTTDLLDPKLAYEVGIKLLRTIDIAVVPSESVARMSDLVPIALAGKRSLTLYESVEALPKADEFCTLAIRLKHASPRDLQAAVINLVTYPQNCLSVESAGTLVLSDFSSTLRKLGELVRQMDLPPPATSYRVGVAILEGRSDREASVPEAFKTLELDRATGRNHFSLLGEMFTRIDVPSAPRLRPIPPGVPAGSSPALPADAVLRLAGPMPLLVEFTGSLRPAGGVALERFTVRVDREQTQVGPRLLETRVEVAEGDWVILGSVSGEKPDTSLVILVRVRAEN